MAQVASLLAEADVSIGKASTVCTQGHQGKKRDTALDLSYMSLTDRSGPDPKHLTQTVPCEPKCPELCRQELWGCKE